MYFTDYKGRKIILSDESWMHVQEGHPEITIDAIERTLRDPDEVRRSRYSSKAELFYQLRATTIKTRYCCVIVKDIEGKCFVSSAATVSSLKTGETLFSREGK